MKNPKKSADPLGVLWRGRATSGFPLPTLPPGHPKFYSHAPLVSRARETLLFLFFFVPPPRQGFFDIFKK